MDPARSRATAGALLACAALLRCSVARADVTPPVRVDIAAPAGCATTASFVERLRARNARLRVEPGARGPAPAGRALHVEVEPRGRRFIGRLIVRERDGSETERTIEGDTCAEVVSSLVFVAAVAVDATPDAKATDEEPEKEPDKEPASAPPKPAPSALAPPPPAKPPLDEGRAPAAWAVAMGVDGQIVSGPSPSMLFAVPVFVDVARTTPGLFAPSARLQLERASATTRRATSGAEFTWTAAAADLCPIAWSPDRLRFDPCVRTELGVLYGSAFGVQPARSASRPWASVGPAAHARVRVSGPVFVELDAALGVPLVRDRFFLEPGTTVFATPGAEWSAAMGLGATL